MSMLVAAFIGLCLYGMIRMLNLASPSLSPNIYSKTRSSEFIQAILASCPILRQPYTPPLLWGKSGHIQTVVYAKMGRMRDPTPSGVRHSITLQDGSTLTFDLYQPTASHPTGGDYCMLVCPGFGSSSESSYIRALVNHAQLCGFRVAVLNHLGCLFSLRLTAPRIFSYGGWEEFHIMRQEVERLYPQSKLIIVGLSMGANIVLKYLGENPSHQDGIWCAISICQGYNINDAKHLLKRWQNLRRAYLYTMTANQRRLIKHHSEILFTEEARRRFGFDLKKIFSATTLEDLDLHFTCKLQGYNDVVDYYESCSCSNYIGNIDIPLILLNSEDDPIVPVPLFKYARDYSESHELAAFVTTKHGGHLGYFENGYIRPQTTSWIDRFVCQIADGVIVFTMQQHNQYASPSSHRFILQVKHLHSDGSLEPNQELEEMTDLSTGEGCSLKTKSSELLAQVSSETLSQPEKPGMQVLATTTEDSFSTIPSDSEICLENVKYASICDSLSQSEAEEESEDMALENKKDGSVSDVSNDLPRFVMESMDAESQLDFVCGKDLGNFELMNVGDKPAATDLGALLFSISDDQSIPEEAHLEGIFHSQSNETVHSHEAGESSTSIKMITEVMTVNDIIHAGRSDFESDLMGEWEGEGKRNESKLPEAMHQTVDVTEDHVSKECPIGPTSEEQVSKATVSCSSSEVYVSNLTSKGLVDKEVSCSSSDVYVSNLTSKGFVDKEAMNEKAGAIEITLPPVVVRSPTTEVARQQEDSKLTESCEAIQQCQRLLQSQQQPQDLSECLSQYARDLQSQQQPQDLSECLSQYARDLQSQQQPQDLPECLSQYARDLQSQQQPQDLSECLSQYARDPQMDTDDNEKVSSVSAKQNSSLMLQDIDPTDISTSEVTTSFVAYDKNPNA